MPKIRRIGPKRGQFAKLDTSQYKTAREITSQFRQQLRFLVRSAAEATKVRVQLSMLDPKTGRRYFGKSGKWIIASAPGEAPAVDTSALFGSIKIRYSNSGMNAEVGSFGDIPYARRLEEGGADSRGIYIAPRPYMAPAFEAQSEEFIRDVQRMIRTSLILK